ncbi:zinc finger protein STOP1 homolog [Silene latifolia]|uniref:zinc finger protein STOP1 homolog n=1 Tax=Silene latifolia TaxID=37657 RepID=UPI003D76F5FD
MRAPVNPVQPGIESDPRVPLTNLAAIQTRLDSLSSHLSDSVNSRTVLPVHQLDSISSELSSAIQNVIINGAALLATLTQPQPNLIPKPEPEDTEIVEVDAVELLAEQVHVCHLCGKGFKRDANLRMHMRSHGDQYKTSQALAKPVQDSTKSNGDNIKRMKFSCPYSGCNRNKNSPNFKPLKSVVCVKNHFKRSHCPKKYNCELCNNKKFSVIGDLKNHMKVCGEEKGNCRCSCGTGFSSKDELFAHLALFQDHFPVFDRSSEKDQLVTASGSGVGSSSGGGFGGGFEYDQLLEGFMGGNSIDECFRF